MSEPFFLIWMLVNKGIYIMMQTNKKDLLSEIYKLSDRLNNLNSKIIRLEQESLSNFKLAKAYESDIEHLIALLGD